MQQHGIGTAVIFATEVFLSRQLGLELVDLSPDLPLFCGVTGAKISEEQDKRIEVLRDALMDAARSRVEELGEDAVAGMSSFHSC